MSDNDREIFNTNDIKQADFTNLDDNKELLFIEDIVIADKAIPNKSKFNIEEFFYNSERKRKQKRRLKISLALIVVAVIVLINSLIFGLLMVKGLDDMPLPEEIIVSRYEEHGYSLTVHNNSSLLQYYDPNSYAQGLRSVYSFKDELATNRITIFYYESSSQAYDKWSKYDVTKDPGINASEQNRYKSRCMGNVFLVGTKQAIDIFDPDNREKFRIIFDFNNQ